MSRTNRTLPAWARSRAQDYMDPDHPWGGGHAQRWARKVLQNRDGAVGSDVHAPGADQPQGFNTWDEVGSGGRRWAKAEAAAARRRQGKAQIRSEQEEYEEC